MTVVKICGLQTLTHALAAANAGADLLGMVFAPSRRQLSAEHAATLVTALRAHAVGRAVGVVGLFVNESPAHINAVVERCNLDYVQLSGDEHPHQAAGICRPILKTLRLTHTPTEQAWIDLVHPGTAAQTPPLIPPATTTPHCTPTACPPIRMAHCPFIIDAYVNGAYGGTGHLADWERSRAFAHTQTILLAGGLNPSNVAPAIAQVQPWGVDVSSGVESNGSKDSLLIEQFVRAVRATAPSQRVAYPLSGVRG